MIVANEVGPVDHGSPADQVLWRLSEPIEYGMDIDGAALGTTEFVITSAVVAYGTGPETYIFAADEWGNVLYWGELSGSLRGALDHYGAIERAGWGRAA